MSTPIPTPLNLPTVSPSAWEQCCPSPDGKWLVRQVVTDSVSVPDDPEAPTWYYRAQYVFSADGRVSWKVVDEWSPGGLGAPYLGVLAWAPDSSAVYVDEPGTADGCDLFGWAANVDRLEVASGKQYSFPRPQGGGAFRTGRRMTHSRSLTIRTNTPQPSNPPLCSGSMLRPDSLDLSRA